MLAKPTVNNTKITLTPITTSLMFAVPHQLRTLPHTSGNLNAVGQWWWPRQAMQAGIFLSGSPLLTNI